MTQILRWLTIPYTPPWGLHGVRPMTFSRVNVLLILCLFLTFVAASSVGFIWSQTTILQAGVSAVSRSSPQQDRYAAHIAPVTSVEQLKRLAVADAKSDQAMAALVLTITSNIYRGVAVLAFGLAALLVSLIFLYRRLAVQVTAVGSPAV